MNALERVFSTDVLGKREATNLEEDRVGFPDYFLGLRARGLVTPFVGKLFFDFIASAREDECTQAIYDFSDHRDYLKALHGRYKVGRMYRTRMRKRRHPDVCMERHLR